MKISLSMPEDSMIRSTGFGNAGYRLTRALQDLGHDVPFRDPTASVEINWAHPSNWIWSSKDSYKIGYTPWESSVVPPKWLPYMKSVDELWTTSPLMARWINDATGIEAKVLQHGIDADLWRPRRRLAGDKVKFLHIGEPAPRKGGAMAIEAFRNVFGSGEEVSLTIKAYNYVAVNTAYNNIILDKRDVVDSELADIVRNHDVLVYPSYGEGFGFIPLEAMASGMPVICTSAWAPYKKFLQPPLRLSSKLVDSPWPNMHPGHMFEPDISSLEAAYRYSVLHFDNVASKAYDSVPSLVKAYDWTKLVSDAFEPVIKKLEK